MTEVQTTPLQMAINCASAVYRFAKAQEKDPMDSMLQRNGAKAIESAQLAGNLALVAIAEDLHKLVEILEAR